MPLYEFRCAQCGARFDALSVAGASPRCPECGGEEPERKSSPISGPLKFGLRGAAARRSGSLRRAREERRLEERARRRSGEG